MKRKQNIALVDGW